MRPENEKSFGFWETQKLKDKKRRKLHFSSIHHKLLGRNSHQLFLWMQGDGKELPMQVKERSLRFWASRPTFVLVALINMVKSRFWRWSPISAGKSRHPVVVEDLDIWDAAWHPTWLRRHNAVRSAARAPRHAPGSWDQCKLSVEKKH